MSIYSPGIGWLVGSVSANNFTSVQSIVDSTESLWQLQNDIITGPPKKGIQLLNTVEYYNDLYYTVQGKRDAGFNISITDYWGRALSFQLVNASEGGPGM